MKRTNQYQKAINENGANRKLREELGIAPIINPGRYEWVRLALSLLAFGLSIWFVVWIVGRAG